MGEIELKANLVRLHELLNVILPVGDERMTASPQEWVELNDLAHVVAIRTQQNADYWREVAARNDR